jgi:hypothetical protein
MYTFKSACLRIILLFNSSILVWALSGAIPETDGLSESHSGKSFDENGKPTFISSVPLVGQYKPFLRSLLCTLLTLHNP